MIACPACWSFGVESLERRVARLETQRRRKPKRKGGGR
jgi:hypothetical protein